MRQTETSSGSDQTFTDSSVIPAIECTVSRILSAEPSRTVAAVRLFGLERELREMQRLYYVKQITFFK